MACRSRYVGGARRRARRSASPQALHRAARRGAAGGGGAQRRPAPDSGSSREARRAAARILSSVSDARSLTLTASLRPAALDARRGIARLHPEVLTALGLNPG